MRLLTGDQIPAVVAACTCPTVSTGHILLPSSPLCTPTSLHLVRLAGFRLIEAGLPENLDVDCQSSLTMCCSLEIERRAVHPGLVHMVQLASKTGATLAGRDLSFPGSILTALYHLLVPLIILLTRPFLDYFVLRYGEV